MINNLRELKTALLNEKPIKLAPDIDLIGVDLSSANLSGVNLSKINLTGTNLGKANLSGANLSEANLNEANLHAVNLSGANLSWVNLSHAYLVGANLSSANLHEANLTEANLSWVNLIGARLNGAVGYAAPSINAVNLILSLAQQVVSNKEMLDMRYVHNVHSCKTAHCAAGWICILDPTANVLEKILGWNVAACTVCPIPEFTSLFYSKNETMLCFLEETLADNGQALKGKYNLC